MFKKLYIPPRAIDTVFGSYESSSI